PSNLGGPLFPGSVMLAVVVDKVFAASYIDNVTFSSWTITGSTLQSLGHLSGPAFVNLIGAKMTISGSSAIIGTGRGGVKIIDISDARNPVPISVFNDSQNFGATWAVGVTGNKVFRN